MYISNNKGYGYYYTIESLRDSEKAAFDKIALAERIEKNERLVTHLHKFLSDTMEMIREDDSTLKPETTMKESTESNEELKEVIRCLTEEIGVRDHEDVLATAKRTLQYIRELRERCDYWKARADDTTKPHGGSVIRLDIEQDLENLMDALDLTSMSVEKLQTKVGHYLWAEE